MMDLMRVMGFPAASPNPMEDFCRTTTREMDHNSNPMYANPNTIKVANSESKSNSHPYTSFADIVSGDIRGAIPLRPQTLPKVVGGKLAIVIKE